MRPRLITLATLSLVTVGGVLPAQIPQRATSLNANAPRLLVATPYTPRAEDSLAAVEAGHGLRERLTRQVTRDYRVIARQQMNDALATYGYPADALLDYHAARTLAQGLSSPLMIFPRWLTIDGGRHRLSARLISTGTSRGAAGHVVSLDQAAGQKPEDVGERTADALRPLIRAYGDAVECYDNAATNRSKAVDAAQKAIRVVPNFGPAEYCLGALAQAADSTSQEALQHYTNAVQGDPFSIPAYAQMASIYFLRGDSAKVISTYQTMLEVDPLDQTLRENAYKIFQAFGRPGAAEEVADAGIARDPANTDWYDLKSNACLVQEKFSCAVQELERLFGVDSTRADTAFYSKITYAARLADDTTSYVKWAGKGVEKYPEHVGMLEEANRAYGWAGNAEGAIATAQRLLQLVPDNYEPVTRTVALLGTAGKAEEALVFLPLVRDSGDPDLKNTFGQVLVNAASQLAGTNLPKADTLSQAAIDAGMDNPQLLSFANYFIGANLFNTVREMSQSVRASRSCEEARTYQQVLQRARPALEGASQSTNEAIRNFTTQTLPAVTSELSAVEEMIGAFCR